MPYRIYTEKEAREMKRSLKTLSSDTLLTTWGELHVELAKEYPPYEGNGLVYIDQLNIVTSEIERRIRRGEMRRMI